MSSPIETPNGPSSAGATSSEFDGKWIGEGPGNMCFGDSKIKFTVKDGMLEGTWYHGTGYINAKTQDFSIEIDSKGKISGYIGAGLNVLRVKGKFSGESATGEIKSSQYSSCVSSWDATRTEQLEIAVAVAEEPAVQSSGYSSFDGRWSGKVDLDCIGIIVPLEIVIQDGDLSGHFTVRGQGEDDGTYNISGYIDRKGRISEGRVQGAFRLKMRGSLSDREGKGQIVGEDCAADWN